MNKREYRAALLTDLTPDSTHLVILPEGKGEVALALHNGTVYAFGSLCPHQNASLQDAPINAGCVLCKRHGYRFDLKSGDCRTVGGYGIPVYEAFVRGSEVFVRVWEWEE